MKKYRLKTWVKFVTIPLAVIGYFINYKAAACFLISYIYVLNIEGEYLVDWLKKTDNKDEK